MKHKKTTLISVLLIALGLFVFFALFESFEETRDMGWDTAARRNPYLAAGLFLEAEGLSVQSEDQFAKLNDLPKKGTLFISNSNHVLSSKRLQTLIQWIKSGGHLIVAAEDPARKNTDRLLHYFSIEARTAENQAAADEKAGDGQKKPTKMSEQLRKLNQQLRDQAVKNDEKRVSFEEEVPENAQSTLVFEDLDTPLKVHFLQDRTLYHPFFDWEDDEEDFEGYRPFYWQGDEQGIHFMQMQVEAGLLSVLSDADIWQSNNIAYFDHAFLLRVLAESSEGVSILYGMNMPSVFALMRRHAPELIFSSLLWLLALLFYRGRRFGPIKSVQRTVRRSMDEHVSASAAYLWRGNFGTQLLMPLQTEIEKRACRILPTFDPLEKDVRLDYLSQKSGLPLEQIEKAMSVEEKQNEADFIQAVSCLQKIRRSL